MKGIQEIYNDYKKKIDIAISEVVHKDRPVSLYDPLKYILSGGGKRIRPMMLIFSCEAAGGKAEDCLNAAVAIELLHNFTLVHDDIMDNADSRRGKETIHKKWNENVAILCGDHLIGLAYEYLFKTNSQNIRKIAQVFTDGIIEVCEGQSFDKEFENENNVSVEDYLNMISKKTAKMLETSAIIGGLIGDGDPQKINSLKYFASNIGIAFQILDDYLDIAADEAEFGKKIGGDIIEGKRTFLLLKAKEFVSDKTDAGVLETVFKKNYPENRHIELISDVKQIYEKYGVTECAKAEIENYTSKAEEYLDALNDEYSKAKLKWLSQMLMGRTY